MISIRNATIEDVPEILKVVNHAILYSTANYNYEPQTLEEQLDWFQTKTTKGNPILCAFDGNSFAGFATYGTFREKIGYQFTAEHSVYVAPGMEGKGIGTKLMKQLISIAKDSGIHCLVGGIDAENKESLRFHERLGFLQCGKINQAAWKFDRWLDLLFMQLILD
ncbi:GNAT family N-acetyltransferase [Flavobacterium silvaticum]|uniref:N-acetyltransferase n=1 Tax=Flavobacterium silvaticum TaxID=1852020 RepID=A0A972FT86_9FLAO|nr:GNAT family N-acetyltransferase [Flavobacterium silvaticum]NMH28939.1 N-acetyltransferase [Flavobacterium silvaticum]